MSEKQVEIDQAPPPYVAHPGPPPQGQPGYPAQPQPGYQTQPQPGYPQPGYPQPGYPQPGYPQPGQPYYPPPAQPYYPPPAPAPAPAPVVAPVQTVSNNVNVIQIGATPTTAVVPYPPDYCGMAWFACLCCFWPLGIFAIINSNNTRDAIARSDLDSARYSSELARKYSNWSIAIGICLIILIIIVSSVA